MAVAKQTIFSLLILVLCALPDVSLAGNKDKAHSPVRRDWGEIRWMPMGLELHVTKLPADGTVSIPRLNNPIEIVYLKNDKQKKPLQLKPEIKTWIISLPKSSAGAKITVIVKTKGKPHIPVVPRVVTQADDGLIMLPAHEGVTHGKMLRYEPQPHKNTIGYWVNVKDWCEWHFKVEKPGRFEVHVLQGCGKGQGGSKVAVKIDKHQIHFTVEDTGHFQKFKDRKIGSVTISSSGTYSLQIRPVSKAVNAIMDVRRVRLVPVER